MSASNTAFLFVPGAWCPGYYYHKVAEKIQAQGYKAVYMDLLSMGRKDKAPSLQDVAAHVRSEATDLLGAGHDLVIVGNSYGGFVTLEVCKGLVQTEGSKGGQLKHIITINSPLGQKGQSMKDLVGDEAPIPKDDSDPWLDPVPAHLGYPLLFGSLAEAEGKEYAGMMGAQSLRPLLEPLTFAAYEEVPCTAVISGKDLAYKPESQNEVCVVLGVEFLR